MARGPDRESSKEPPPRSRPVVRRSRQGPAPVVKRRESRHARELRRQRYVRIGMAIALGLVVLVLAGGAINEYILKPRATLATVNGVPIRRADYWKARAADLNAQAAQYAQFAQFTGPDQAGQFESMAQESLRQIPDVWGSTDTDPRTLGKMIEDQLYLQGAENMGLAVSPADAETWALSQFAPADAPLLTPAPTATYIPERATMMTATAAAFEQEQRDAGFLFGTPEGTPDAQPADATPGATPVGGEVTAPDPEATPSLADARATAEAGFSQFEEVFFPAANMSREDYLRLVAAPNVARENVRMSLASEVGQTAPMVEAAHILVETKDLADKLAADLASGADFGELARVNSTDTGTGANGGDLGWFTREEMVAPFADAAFALAPGETSAPVESEFGWHIIRVHDADPERPLTDEQITRIEQARTAAWLEEQRAAAQIDSSLPPTPTPFAGGFQPPLNAPPLPPMEDPFAMPAATPVE
jgi:hypothetical protein